MSHLLNFEPKYFLYFKSSSKVNLAVFTIDILIISTDIRVIKGVEVHYVSYYVLSQSNLGVWDALLFVNVLLGVFGVFYVFYELSRAF